MALANLVQQLHKRGLDARVVGGGAEPRLIVDGHLLLEDAAGVRRKLDRVDAKDGDEAGLLGVAVHKRRRQQAGAAHVDVLDALGRNVLALGELEHVLLAVDDLEAAHAVDLDDVARVEPAVGLDRLGRLVGVLEVLLEDDGPAHQQLAARVRLVLDRVLVVGHRLDAQLHRRARGTDIPRREVVAELHRAYGVRLGHAEALHECIAKGGAEEVVHVGVELRAAAAHGARAVEADALEHLGRPDAVEQKVRVVRLALAQLHVGLLGLDDAPGEGPLDAVGLDGRRLDGRVEAIVQTRDRVDAVGPQNLHVLHQPGDVAVEVADARTDGQRRLVGHAAVDVRQREVRDVGVGGADRVVGAGGADAGDGVGMRDQDALGVTSSARSVVDRDDVVARGRVHGAAAAGTNGLDVLHGEDLEPDSLCARVEQIQLGRAGGLAGVQWVERDDELERGDAGGELQEGRDVVDRADDGREAAVVDDVLARLRAEGLVEGDGPEGLGDQRQL